MTRYAFRTHTWSVGTNLLRPRQSRAAHSSIKCSTTQSGTAGSAPHGRDPALPIGREARRGRSQLQPGDSGRPPPTSEIAGATRCDEPRPPVAGPTQARRSPRAARPDLRLVHRGIRDGGSEGREDATGRTGMSPWSRWIRTREARSWHSSPVPTKPPAPPVLALKPTSAGRH